MILIVLIDIVVVLALVVASRRRLEDALPLLSFLLVLMPIESRIVIPGVIDVSTERIALMTVFILFIRRGPKIKTFVPMKSLMYIHITWVVLSTLYSLSVATSIKQLIGQVVEYYLLYYLLIRTTSKIETVYKVLYAMALAMGICSIFGLLESYSYWSILTIFPAKNWIVYGGPGPLYVEWGRGLRARSTFPHPILFGDALAMTIPITIYLLSIWRRKSYQRMMLWLALALMFGAVYKTSSRGPWIATGLSVAFLFLLVRNRARKYILAIVLMASLVLVSRPGVFQTIFDLYVATQDANSPVGASFEFRQELTDAIHGALKKDPSRALLGYGLGTFRELGLEIKHLGEVSRWYTCDDNWVCFMYETGYVGFAIIALLLLQPILVNLRAYRNLPPPERALSAVMLISLLTFDFGLMSVAGYNWGQQGFMAWILIAMSISYARMAKQKPLEQRRGTFRRSALLTEQADATPEGAAGSLVFSKISSLNSFA